MHELISKRFLPVFDAGVDTSVMDTGVTDTSVTDAAVLGLPAGSGRIAISTDSYVVSPIFFPGGDIGEMAVYGTVNDLAMVGAKPLYITAGFIIEEGLRFDDLDRIVGSMARAAKRAGVRIVAGDTKVVDKGKGDGIFINTAGVGIVPDGVNLSPKRIAPGDSIIISGPIGNHGVAVMSERNGLSFDPPVLSDTAPLNRLAGAIVERFGADVKVMRDPTRGGVATTLKEFALDSGLCMSISEEAVPVPQGVSGACDLLGLDPLYVANEGIMLAVVKADVAEYVLESMRSDPQGAEAALIGRAELSPAGAVVLKTRIGGSRLVDMLQGQQLPRIC